jgi:hypothetical protein
VAEYVVEFGKDGRPVEADGRLDAAAFHRNQPIWNVPQKFPAGKSGDVLEAGAAASMWCISPAMPPRCLVAERPQRRRT